MEPEQLVKLISDFNFDPTEERFVLLPEDELLKDALGSILSDELFAAIKHAGEAGEGVVNLNIGDVVVAVIKRTLATKAFLVKSILENTGEF